MKVEFKYTFFESIEKLVWYDTKLWKVWAAIRYDIPLFFKNIWRFRKELYNHQWWDYRFTLEMLYRSLSIMVVKLEKDGIEEDSSRMKKVQKINRALELIKHKLDDDYIERAELELGQLSNRPLEFEPVKGKEGFYSLVNNDTPSEKKRRNKIYVYANKLEGDEWKEIWKIFEGQDIKQFSKLLKTKTKEEQKNSDVWGEWFDGSGMRRWWD